MPGDIDSDPSVTGQVLNQALPYLQRFRGKTFVVKYGGAAMENPGTMTDVLRNVLLLGLVGIRIVLVHGGGPEIDRWLAKLGIQKRFHEGLRVTDEATMEVVEMALSGRANKALVAAIGGLGGRGVGLSGRDAGILLAEPISEELGRTGRIVNVDASLLVQLTEGGALPVVCSVAGDADGRALNINADAAAAAIAGALGAEKLIVLTDTPGVLASRDDRGSTISKLTIAEGEAMILRGEAAGGMIPKLESAFEALRLGVTGVHLIDASAPNALLVELFTRSGIGTMVSH